MRRLSRYNQARALQSSMDLKTANDHKSKQLNTSTSFVNKSAALKNPEVDLLRLPALGSSRRSASLFTERNTKFKLQNIEEKLQELAADVHNTRLEANETLKQIHYLRQNIAGQELNQARDDLKKQVRGLQRLIKATQVSDEDRTRSIKNDCAQLWKQTELLHQFIFELKMRSQTLEESMGFCQKSRE